MTIKKLRKKLRNNRFVDHLIDRFRHQLFELNQFLMFDCNVHLRGTYLAAENTVLYAKNYKRVVKLLDFLKKQRMKNLSV